MAYFIMARQLGCCVAITALVICCLIGGTSAADSPAAAVTVTMPPVRPVTCTISCPDPTAPYCVEVAGTMQVSANKTAPRPPAFVCDSTLYAPKYYPVNGTLDSSHKIQCPANSVLGYYNYYLGYGAVIYACWPIATGVASNTTSTTNSTSKTTTTSRPANVTSSTTPVATNVTSPKPLAAGSSASPSPAPVGIVLTTLTPNPSAASLSDKAATSIKTTSTTSTAKSGADALQTASLVFAWALAAALVAL